MTFFENCKEYYNNGFFSTKTYNSFSKESNLTQGNGKYLLPYSCEQTHVPKGKFIGDKSPHVEKLRNILTEAVSNITKENKLKKGESVELTLEIELLKSTNNTPTNSLVEVTIIQHNKSEKGGRINGHKMPFQVDMKNSSRESASQKQGNWFRRVVNQQYEEKSVFCEREENNKIEITDKNKWNFTRDGMDCFVVSNENITDNDRRKNFVTVLPEEILVNEDFKKGYRRVSPNKKKLKAESKRQKQSNIVKESSLVKKLSDVFLPTKKVEKHIAVNTALTALKNEVDNMKLETERNMATTKHKEDKRAPVHNLGKLVSNIPVDVVESSDSDKDQTVQYKRFFEPILNRKKIHGKKSKKRKMLKKNIIESHSDTCIHHRADTSNVKLKSSNSMNDCRAITNSNAQTTLPAIHGKDTITGDSSQINSRKKKTKQKTDKQRQRKNGRGDAKDHSNHKLKSKIITNDGQSKLDRKKTSTIFWNGETIEINKEIKKRIEMLILNELQNLALKEGMECDVTPLPSTEDSMTKLNTVEKMSSFMCKLDISDAKIKKTMKNIKTVDSKLKMKQSHPSLNKSKSRHMKTKGINETKKTDKNTILGAGKKDKPNIDNSKTSSSTINNSGETSNEGITLNLSNNIEVEGNDVEVTYLNLNVKNWSAESHDLAFRSLIGGELGIQPVRTDVLALEENNSHENHFASGFVRRIASNDSTWKKFLSRKTSTEKIHSTNKIKTLCNKKTMMHFSSVTSQECESKIEIEFDIRDLELLLKEAKEIQNASKVLISAKCNNYKNYKGKTPITISEKNSPFYTNQLLIKASKKLEKYAKVKQQGQEKR